VSGRPAIDRVVEVARRVRADLLGRAHLPRDLAGHCGLASMHLAAALDDPRLLRVGFYMKNEMFCGRRGRYPNRHAWCQLGETIVDVTATQFGRNRAVHVAIAADDDRYVETADSDDAVDDIMSNWRGRELREYAILARRLRRRRA
jgi:hypothetical protein